MSVFTLAIFFLTSFNLLWFMDLTCQLPINIVLYSIGLYFHHQSHPQLGIVFAMAPSYHSFWNYFSTVLQQHIGHLGSSSFTVINFRIFILFMGLSKEENWSGLPFSLSVGHILSEISTITCQTWVAPHNTAQRFIVSFHFLDVVSRAAINFRLHVSFSISIDLKVYA